MWIGEVSEPSNGCQESSGKDPKGSFTVIKLNAKAN